MKNTVKTLLFLSLSLGFLSNAFSQRSYWDSNYNKKKKEKDAYFYSTEQIEDGITHRDYFKISDNKKVKSLRITNGIKGYIVGRVLYTYWDNGQLKTQHTLNITSGKPRKVLRGNPPKNMSMDAKFLYTTEMVAYYENGDKRIATSYRHEDKKYTSERWTQKTEEKAHIDEKTPEKDPKIADVIRVDEEPKPLNIDEIKRNVGFPIIARDRGLQGQVVVRVLVDKTGKVIDFKTVMRLHPFLDTHVEIYTLDLAFTPAILNGKAIAFWVNIPFNFKLLY